MKGTDKKESKSKATHKRSVQAFPRNHYFTMFIADCHSQHKGKTILANEIFYGHYDKKTVLEKDRLHILYAKMTQEQRKNPKLLPGE